MGSTGLIWRGEVYEVDLGQPVGHESTFRRPAVVVSVDVINDGPGGLVTVVPITTQRYGLRSHVELDSDESGLGHVSSARCDQIRAISRDRLTGHRGMVSAEERSAIDRALRFVLDL